MVIFFISSSFNSNNQLSRRYVAKQYVSMEYIPDGLTKKQWEQIKKKEAEELKAKVRPLLLDNQGSVTSYG